MIGSFSPPHKGHWSAIKMFLERSNCKILISRLDGHRHGISNNLSRKILNIYAKDYYNKITIIRRCCNNEILNHVYDIDVVVCIRGDEGQSHRLTESKTARRFRDVTMDLRSRGKYIDFYFESRPLLNVLSSTIFTSTIISKIASKGHSRFYRELSFYLPDHIGMDNIIYVLNRIADELVY